ncbi:hypothetical protein N7468_003133 [Penicillium chermesinum]|uniref:Uncharacterized protein n=1 Tax=Penicillium chermesinum TaxID=63820 RepID=A0A9W9P623_9EURO|nr:uncharacterized protein N7468_003133 [Penicillium chermesinum]KAJ5238514.1 hypothetical protein N7468_003133 [Penicillium chermesinum]
MLGNFQGLWSKGMFDEPPYVSDLALFTTIGQLERRRRKPKDRTSGSASSAQRTIVVIQYFDVIAEILLNSPASPLQNSW